MKVSAQDCAHEVLEVVMLVLRIIRTVIRNRRAPDLSVQQFRSLFFLNLQPGAALSDIAENIGLTLPSMSKMIDNLVARELVTRHICPTDRRRVRLMLTASGKDLIDQALLAVQSALAERLTGLPATERTVIVRAMQTLRPIVTPEGR
jgi:DNA-binding MarR family transcriptional regulator